MFIKGNRANFLLDSIAAGQKIFEPMMNWTRFEILINIKYLFVVFGVLWVLYNNIDELNTVFLIGEETASISKADFTISSKLLP